MYRQYDQAVKGVLEYLKAGGYSKTPNKDFRQAARELRTFLLSSNHTYSQMEADVWLNDLKHRVSRTRYLSSRRALALIDQVLTHGYVKQTRFPFEVSRIKYQVPERFREHLQSYLNRRKENGCCESTLNMDRIACARFLLFLDSRGITSLSVLTPEIAKAFTVQTRHRTVEGKNAYIRRVRGFLRFLASQGVVSDTLEFALPVKKAIRVSIVKTLSPMQVVAIDDYRKAACTPSELRNAAMAMVALHLGLRSIDICNLRLSDIDWHSATVSIIQHKTGKPLSLPLPAVVGNTLSRYLLEGRPDCDSPYVFITLKHPYQQVHHSSCCYRSSIEILGAKSNSDDIRGLHIARRTFASRLLKANTPVSLIAQALGHADETTIDEYLATDVQRMRTCAIGLAGIGYSGALL